MGWLGKSAKHFATRWSLVVIAVMSTPTVVLPQFTNRHLQQRNRMQSGNVDEHIRRLSDPDPGKRLEAVRQLAASRDRKAVEYLIQSLGDPDLRIRAKAVEALGEMRAADATQVLVQQLFLRTCEQPMKQRILAALGKIGDPGATRPIMEFLQLDNAAAMRGTAVFALGEIGAIEALEVLEQIAQFDGDPTVRRLAREAAAKVQHYQSAKQREAKGPTDTFLPKAPAPPSR